MSSVSDLSNIEAILNICANLTEIVGTRFGFNFTVASALIASLKQGKISRNCFVIGLGAFILGFGTPSVLQWLVASIRNNHAEHLFWTLAVLSGIFTLAVAIAGLGLLYLPVHIAKKRQKNGLGWIIALSVSTVLIPFLWSVALYLAYKEDKRPQ